MLYSSALSFAEIAATVFFFFINNFYIIVA